MQQSIRGFAQHPVGSEQQFYGRFDSISAPYWMISPLNPGGGKHQTTYHPKGFLHNQHQHDVY